MLHKRYHPNEVTEAQRAYMEDAKVNPQAFVVSPATKFISHLLMTTIDCLIQLTEALEDIADRRIDDDDGEEWKR
jgi:hypothetical protein